MFSGGRLSGYCLCSEYFLCCVMCLGVLFVCVTCYCFDLFVVVLFLLYLPFGLVVYVIVQFA